MQLHNIDSEYKYFSKFVRSINSSNYDDENINEIIYYFKCSCTYISILDWLLLEMRLRSVFINIPVEMI